MRWLLMLGLSSVAMAAASQAESLPWGDGTRVSSKTLLVGPPGSPFSMPTDCAVAQHGDLYVLDGVNHRVVVYDANGTFQHQFGGQGSEPGQFQFPLGLAVAPDGRVYVADSGNSRFQVFSSAGEWLDAVAVPATGPDAPSDPTDLGVDVRSNRLFVVDNDNHRVHVYNQSSRTFEAVWGGPGQGRRQFRYPFLMDVSDQGYLLIVEPINTRVQVLNSDGKFVNFVGQWGVKSGQLFRPKGVAVVGTCVYVTDSYLGRIQIFDVFGEFQGILSDASGTPVALTTPTGLCADIANRRLYVVELKANRVCRLEVE